MGNHFSKRLSLSYRMDVWWSDLKLFALWHRTTLILFVFLAAFLLLVGYTVGVTDGVGTGKAVGAKERSDEIRALLTRPRAPGEPRPYQVELPEAGIAIVLEDKPYPARTAIVLDLYMGTRVGPPPPPENLRVVR